MGYNGYFNALRGTQIVVSFLSVICFLYSLAHDLNIVFGSMILVLSVWILVSHSVLSILLFVQNPTFAYVIKCVSMYGIGIFLLLCCSFPLLLTQPSFALNGASALNVFFWCQLSLCLVLLFMWLILAARVSVLQDTELRHIKTMSLLSGV